MTARDLLFERRTPHGIIVGVAVPQSAEETLTRAASLHPEERRHLLQLAPGRRPSFAAGRLALRAAFASCGLVAEAALLPNERGAPAVPPGARASISHKSRIAVALVTKVDDAAGRAGLQVGIDLEEERAPKIDISVRVLTPSEQRRLPSLPEARWRAILLKFCVKEALYKAVDPFVRRYVSFDEAEVEVAGSDDCDYGEAHVALTPGLGEGPFLIDARWERVLGHILATVRIQTQPAGDVR